MTGPRIWNAEDDDPRRLGIVFAILRGEITPAAAAEKHDIPVEVIVAWTDAALVAMERSARPGDAVGTERREGPTSGAGAGRRVPVSRRLAGVFLVLALIVVLVPTISRWIQPIRNAKGIGSSPGVPAAAVRPRWRAPSKPWPSPWTALEDVYPDVMGILRDRAGTPWVVTKYSMIAYPGADDRHPFFDLLPETPFAIAPARPYAWASLSAAHVSSDTTACAGTWDGDLLVRNASGWKVAVRSEWVGRGRVHAVARRADRYFVAGRQTWSVRTDGSDLRLIGELSAAGVRSFCLASDGRLYAGGAEGLFVLEDPGWRRVWRRSSGSGAEITCLFEDSQGRLLVGKNGDGLYRFSKDGTDADHLLPGQPIQAIAEDPRTNTLWVGVWGKGLFRRTNDAWAILDEKRGLPDNDVIGLGVDGRGRLWCGLYGYGVGVVDPKAIASVFSDMQAPPRAPTGR